MSKKQLLLLGLVLVLVSCSAKKQIETAISHGDYNKAIDNALRKLKTNSHKKRKADYIVMLKEAYAKVLEQDLQRISLLEKDANKAHYATIYESYLDLDARQNAIKAVLPLYYNNKEVRFTFNNYNNEIVEYRYKTSDYLISEGIELLSTKTKVNAKEAHGVFSYIESINPNYKNVRALLQQAHKEGIDYVQVSITNSTQQFIPYYIEDNLLDFNAYGLDEFWTQYHTSIKDSIAYDFAVDLNLKHIEISPELISEQKFIRKKEIIDGWKYELDANGNVAKDSLGNAIKVDNIITIRARYFEVSQTKSSEIFADVVLEDLKNSRVIERFPIDSDFVFENTFGHYRGDKRALKPRDIKLVNTEELYFPTDEQLLADTSNDLKYKLKTIIADYNF